MVTFTSDQWVIVALVFILGLLIGAFLTSGGRRKWKARYREESTRREGIERELRDDRERWATREKEWREQEPQRVATARDRSDQTDERRAGERRVADRRNEDPA